MSKFSTQKMTRRTILKASGLVIGITLLVACGNTAAPTPPAAVAGGPNAAQSSEATNTPDPDETPAPTPDGRPTATLPPGTVLLEIGTSTIPTEFKYDKETLVAPVGSKIKLKFTNNTLLKDEIGHNWVLVKPGQEDSVVANGKTAGNNKDWLKKDDPGIIAHTKLIEGGEKDTIMFDAPAAGSYTYLSTFPDQYAGGMKGMLTIK